MTMSVNVVGQVIHTAGGLLPRHVNLKIEHQPHVVMYQTVEEWLSISIDTLDALDVTPEDRAEMVRTGEVWEISWHPDTPVGSHAVAAATLARALEIASGYP